MAVDDVLRNIFRGVDRTKEAWVSAAAWFRRKVTAIRSWLTAGSRPRRLMLSPLLLVYFLGAIALAIVAVLFYLFAWIPLRVLPIGLAFLAMALAYVGIWNLLENFGVSNELVRGLILAVLTVLAVAVFHAVWDRKDISKWNRQELVFRRYNKQQRRPSGSGDDLP